MMKFRWLCAAIMVATCIPFMAGAKPISPADIPSSLKPWERWVMHDVATNTCPFLYLSQDQRVCFWPTKLAFDLGAQGGSFAYDITLYETPDGLPQRIILPGQTDLWPQNVSANGESAPVLLYNAAPSLLLGAGTYTIRGDFRWDRAPVSLRLPPQVGVVSLTRMGVAVAIPDIESDQLWIERTTGEQVQTQEDHIEAKLFRKLSDTIPQTLETVAQLNVAGKPREQVLGVILPDGVIPMSVVSDLPARLERDGNLRVQLRPGNWQIRIAGRYEAKQDNITVPKASGVFAPEEIWSFEAQNHLRLVQVEGVNAIDPTQTELPPEWHSLPSYYVKGGDTLALSEKKRGIADETPDQLSIHRKLWLDYSGKGFTFEDGISGAIRRSNRLEVSEGITLGNATINGQSQYITTITRDGVASRPGIEVREGAIQLQANSRSDGRGVMSVAGWDNTFDRVSATLYLPPGWSLWSYSGVDSASESWIKRWSLLDIFLVLVAAVAMLKWSGRRAGAITLLGLILIHPELPAFTSLFLTLLALSVVLHYLPSGWFAWLTGWLHRLALLALLLITLPFIVDHIREALYPQLGDRAAFPLTETFDKRVAGTMQEREEGQMMGDSASAPIPESLAPMMTSPDEVRNKEATDSLMARGMFKGKGAAALPQQYQLYAPDTRVQTGFGTRNISERGITLSWNGSVDASAKMRLTLISPSMNLLLACVRAVLLIALIGLLVRQYWEPMREVLRKPAAAALLMVLAMSMMIPSSGYAQEASGAFPPEKLLGDLKTKLTQAQQQPASCLPECATLARTLIQVSGNQLMLQLEIHARENVAVPLPGSVANWRPQSVIVGEQQSPSLMVGSDGYLLVNLTTGVHRIRMVGALPQGRDSVGITFPLTSRYSQVLADGWSVSGVRENGVSENSVQLVRTAKVEASQAQENTLEKTRIPPFYSVERMLVLGSRWEVFTTISRLTPADEAAAIRIPLLTGETVISGEATVKDGKFEATFNPGVSQVSWQSVMNPVDQLALSAPTDTPWVEVWKLNATNLWHVTTQGIPRVYEAEMATPETFNVMPEQGGVWSWMPWPGEALAVTVLRPQGVEGETRTMDESTLRVTPSTRSTDLSLTLSIRSSLGGQHEIRLPQGAILKQVSKDGLTLPTQLKDGLLSLPLVPGSNRFLVEWKENAPLIPAYRSPAVDIGLARSVNANVQMILPQDRWILMTFGPPMGPAVLFWSWLPVVLLMAFVLGKIPFTPLAMWHWFLLLLGMSMTSIVANMVVIGWLLALGYRARLAESVIRAWKFNLMQIALVLLTLISIGILYDSIEGGLLGQPDMRIAGNGSYASDLRWYQDITASLLPQPLVVSVSVWFYRVLMLIWALWLAFSLVSWLRWGFGNFTSGGYWRTVWGAKTSSAAAAKTKESGPTD